jgi:redox-sensitive bicupin YhaK (pirin superfamily)
MMQIRAGVTYKKTFPVQGSPQIDSHRVIRRARPFRHRASGCQRLGGRLSSGEQPTFRLKPNRHAFAQAVRGAVTLNGVQLSAGDGAAVSQEEILEFRAVKNAEILLFDLLETEA